MAMSITPIKLCDNSMDTVSCHIDTNWIYGNGKLTGTLNRKNLGQVAGEGWYVNDLSGMQLKDFATLKAIPGFNAILKAVLKAQIQALVEQLHDQTGEESLLLTASASDGALCLLGSMKGQGFLEGRQDIKSQFLQHCLNGAPSQNQVPEKGNKLKTIVAGELNPEAKNKGNKRQKHKRRLNDTQQDRTIKTPRSSQQIQSTQHISNENVPLSTACSSDVVQQNKVQYVQSSCQQVPVLSQTPDKTGIYFQNFGQQYTLSLSPNGNHIAVSPNLNNLSVLSGWNNVITTQNGNRAPASQSGGSVTVPPCGNSLQTSLDCNNVSLSRNFNHLSVSSSRNHISTSGNNVTNGNYVSVITNHKPSSANHTFPEGSRISANVSQLHGSQNILSSSLNENKIISSNVDDISGTKSVRHNSAILSQNPVSLSCSGNQVLLTPSGKHVLISSNGNQNTQMPTDDSLIKEVVDDIGTSLTKPLTSKNSEKQDQSHVSCMDTLHVNSVNRHSSDLEGCDILPSGLSDFDKTSAENKDKAKKTLSSKIEEITERIKKDDPLKSLDDEIVTTDNQRVSAPEVKSKGSNTKSENQKTRQRKYGKTKDTSRASHRKPKLPRYNIGAASDEEEAALEEDISAIDILDIAAGIEDSNSSFAHINLDEFGDAMILKESETDMPLVGLFNCNNQDDTNKTLIQNVFNLKPTEQPVSGLTIDETSKMIKISNRDTSATKSNVEIKAATETCTKKTTKEVSLINKKLWLKCSLCPVRFPNQDMLKQHMQTVVHRKKKYVCDLCGWKFGQLRDKERHRRTHTGERPFKCDVCNKTFARKDNLKLHERKHKSHVNM